MRFIRIDGSLFFGSVAHVERAFDLPRVRCASPKHLTIMADGMNFVDLQGAQALLNEAIRRRQGGGDLYLVNVKPGLWETLDSAGFFTTSEVRNVFQPTETAVVHGIFQKPDRDLCQVCEKRILVECQARAQSDR